MGNEIPEVKGRIFGAHQNWASAFIIFLQFAASLAATNFIEAGMPGNAEGPGAHVVFGGHTVQGANHLDESILRQVVCRLSIDHVLAQSPYIALH
jgi:hypothetical protein